MFAPSYRIPGAALTAEPGCPAAPLSGGGRFLMALELTRTEFKVALTPSSGWLLRAAATRTTKTRVAPAAPRAVISEGLGGSKKEKQRGSKVRFASLFATETVLAGLQGRDPGSPRRSQRPDCLAHAALSRRRHRGCLYTAGPEHSGPSGARQQSRDGISKRWEGLEGGVFVYKKWSR